MKKAGLTHRERTELTRAAYEAVDRLHTMDRYRMTDRVIRYLEARGWRPPERRWMDRQGRLGQTTVNPK